MATVSVIIPTYKGGDFVREALESVLAQTLRPSEVIVVDDASPDDTAERVTELARAAPIPVRLIRSPRNSGGPARPINKGIAAASSELIAVLDQDDVFTPTKLERQARVLERHSELAFAFCLCGDYDQPEQTGHFVQSDEVVQGLREMGRAENGYYWLDSQRLFRWLFLYDNFVIGYPAFLFRRRCWEQRGVDPRIPISTDHDFLRWLCRCGPAAFIPERLYLRRAHDANLSVAPNDRWMFEQDVLPVYRRFLRSPWLFEKEDLQLVRRKAFQLADCMRWEGQCECELRWLYEWLEADPDSRPALREHLLNQAAFYLEGEKRWMAFRLAQYAGWLGGWNAQTVRVTAATAASCIMHALGSGIVARMQQGSSRVAQGILQSGKRLAASMPGLRALVNIC